MFEMLDVLAEINTHFGDGAPRWRHQQVPSPTVKGRMYQQIVVDDVCGHRVLLVLEAATVEAMKDLLLQELDALKASTDAAVSQ